MQTISVFYGQSQVFSTYAYIVTLYLFLNAGVILYLFKKSLSTSDGKYEKELKKFKENYTRLEKMVDFAIKEETLLSDVEKSRDRLLHRIETDIIKFEKSLAKDKDPEFSDYEEFSLKDLNDAVNRHLYKYLEESEREKKEKMEE